MASYQKLEPGKYKIFVDVQTHGRRRRRTKTVTAKSQRALKRQMEDFVAEVKNEEPISRSMTFRDFVPRWLDVHVSKLHMKTREKYKDHLKKKPILEFFGDMEIKNIRAYHVVDFFNQMEKDGIGDLRGAYICLSSILSVAEKWDLIEMSPMHKIKCPKPVPIKRPVKGYTGEQLKYLTKLLKTTRLLRNKAKMQIKFGYLLCLRESEIAGIDKRDINFKDRYIEVKRQLQWDQENKCFRYNPLKNGKEKRVYFSKKFEPELRAFVSRHNRLKMACGSTWYKFIDPAYSKEPIELLFTSNIGRPIAPDVISRVWIRFIRKTDLPELNFHGLRHSGISYMLNRGVLSKEVQEQAGHSNDKITKEIYWQEEEKKRSLDVSIFDEII